MMGHREPLRGAAEVDYLTKSRRWRIRRAGDTAAVKRGFNKRARKAARLATQSDAG